MNHFVEACEELLDGVYSSFDRIVMGSYFIMLHSAGGLLTWFRRLHPDKPLDKNQLLRFAYRAARRLYKFAEANGIPVLDNLQDARKHEVAQSYLKDFSKDEGIFLIIKTREMMPIYESRTPKTKPESLHRHLEKKMRYVNYYYFHIKDKKWGHVTIGMCPHPPFAAKVILNGHNWLAQCAERRGVEYEQRENCFTGFADEAKLQKLADTLNEGHLEEVCRRWLPRVMMSLTNDELRASGIARQQSLMQVEYCTNLLFREPRVLDWVYQNLLDNTRQHLRPEAINAIFGRERRGGKLKSMRVHIENPSYNLTVVNIWFGKNRLKLYDKGERVLRVEVTINLPKALGLKKSLSELPQYRRRMESMITNLLNTLKAADQCRLPGEVLEELQAPVITEKLRLPGISLTHRRVMTVLSCAVELAKNPLGFTLAELYPHVVERLAVEGYTKSQLTYDLRKLRGKELLEKIPEHQRYRFSSEGLQKAVGLLVFRDEILRPVLSNAHLAGKRGPKPKLSPREQLVFDIQLKLEALCLEYGLK
jgi:hypothetical protein